GFYYLFSRQPSAPIVIINDNQAATFTNILLKDFPVAFTTFGTNSYLTFGHLTTVEIGQSGILSNPWQFQGQTILNGQGKTIQFSGNGAIVLRPGSSILLDNITFQSLSGMKIRCLDSRCTVSIGNIIWKQTGDFTFTQGKIEVIGIWDLQGTSTFAYQSSGTRTINNFGMINLDNDITA